VKVEMPESVPAGEAERFVEILAPAVRQAAGVARALEGRVQNRPKAGEASDVKAALTLADSAAQEAILVPLAEHFPHVALEAEEDTPSVGAFPIEASALVVVDPIDGTLRCFLEGQGPYAVLVGLAREDRYQAALVALPREGLFFDASRGGSPRFARAGGAPRPARPGRSGQRVLVSPGLPEPAQRVIREAGLDPHPGSGGSISVAPLVPGVCGGLRLAAPGRQISRQGRIGLLVSRAAGLAPEARGEQPFPEGLDDPADALLLSPDPAVLEILRRALEAVPRGG